MKKFWTLREVCAFMRCSESTARRWIAESRRGIGTFPLPIQQKKGGKLLFDPQALARWAEARQATPQPATLHVRASKQEQQAKKRRLELAQVALERHRKQKQQTEILQHLTKTNDYEKSIQESLK